MAASALSHHNPHHRHHHHPNPAGPSRQASSSQFTRSASTFGTGSGYATPSSASLQMAGNSSQQHLTATHIPPPEKEGFRAMMRNMVQQPKYAVFDVNVTIEALEQVPQTEGVFEARWKFNGKSPAGKEASRLHHKVSMPEIRTPHSAAQSTISLKSNASSSSASSPTASLHPATSGQPRTTSSTATIHSPLSMTAANPNQSPPRMGKKASDPTPLRQSSKPRESESEREEVVESPVEMPNPIDLASPATSLKEIGAGGNVPLPSTAGAGEEGEGALRINTGLPRSGSQFMNLPDTSMRSFSSNMAQRTARTANVPAPIRSGTGPSPAVLLGVPPSATGGRPDMSRSPTGYSVQPTANPHDNRAGEATRSSLDGAPTTATSGASTHSGTSRNGSKYSGIGLGRSRTRGSVDDKPGTEKEETESDSRKGVTSAKRLRQHACQWNYTVHHTIKIPMGRPVTATPMHSGTATPNPGVKKELAPILGGGQHSESGFRLIINEIRTSHTTSADHAGTPTPTSAVHQQHEESGMRQKVEGVEKALKHPTKNAHAIKEHRLVFGTIEFDLAQFAGKGKVNRRFLLKGSRTNAVVAVKVELQQVGGEMHWAAPPLQEGHHVTTSDFTGSSNAPRPPELTLNRNSSNSSTGSSISGFHTSESNLNIPQMRPRSRSEVSLSNAPAKVAYKSYHEHLKPTDTPASMGRSRSRRHRTPHTPPDSPRTSQPSVAQLDSPSLAPDTTPRSPSSHGRRDSTLPFDRNRRTHRHHSIHLRNFGAGGLGGDTVRRHRHHHMQDASGFLDGVHDLPPEVVIENIFNPRPGRGVGLVPNPLQVPTMELDEGEGQDDNGIITIGNTPPAEPKRKTWGLKRGNKKEKEKANDQWVIASLSGSAMTPGQEGGSEQQLPPGGDRDDAEVRTRRGGLDGRTQSSSTLRAFHLGHGQARTPVGTA